MIISVDIHRELTDSVSELEYFLSVKNIEITLYAQARQSQPSTFNPRQYLQSLEIPKQISYVLGGILTNFFGIAHLMSYSEKIGQNF